MAGSWQNAFIQKNKVAGSCEGRRHQAATPPPPCTGLRPPMLLASTPCVAPSTGSCHVAEVDILGAQGCGPQDGVEALRQSQGTWTGPSPSTPAGRGPKEVQGGHHPVLATQMEALRRPADCSGTAQSLHKASLGRMTFRYLLHLDPQARAE